jgi:hypothetical protein
MKLKVAYNRRDMYMSRGQVDRKGFAIRLFSSFARHML